MIRLLYSSLSKKVQVLKFSEVKSNFFFHKWNILSILFFFSFSTAAQSRVVMIKDTLLDVYTFNNITDLFLCTENVLNHDPKAEAL